MKVFSRKNGRVLCDYRRRYICPVPNLSIYLSAYPYIYLIIIIFVGGWCVPY